MMLGFFALYANSNAQIKLWNHGGTSIGDTIDPGIDTIVFFDDVVFNGGVSGITFPDPPPANNFDYKVYFDNDIEVDNGIVVTNGSYQANYNSETINFSRNSSNYITAGTAGGVLAFTTNGIGNSVPNALLYLSTNNASLRYGSAAGSISEKLKTTSTGVTITGKAYGRLDTDAVQDFFSGQNNNSGTSAGANIRLDASGNNVQLAVFSDNHSTYGANHSRLYSTAGGAEIGIGSSTELGLLYSLNGALDLYYDNSVKLSTSSTGITVNGTVSLADNNGIFLGDATKGLKMYSNGTYFWIGKGSATTGLSFYITSEIGTTYLYSANTYLGASSGDQIHLRGNLIDGNNWSISTNGSATFSGLNINGSSTVDAITADGAGRFNSGLTAYQSLTIYGTFNNMSDEKLKTDIKDLKANSLDKITSLQGVTYKFKNDEARNSFTGFIAQDVQKVFPELVSEQEDGMAIKTLELIPHLVEAIKEQQEIIESLEARIKTLEAK